MVDLIGLLVVLLVVASTVMLILSRLRLPPVIGYIFSGILLGPHVLGRLHASGAVLTLAEIGVLLLMFTIGLEFDTRYFMRIRRVALGGGMMQILLTIVAAVGAGWLLGWSLRSSVFIGCIVALSSTAVVLKSLMQYGLLDTLPGRLTVGILIFQDLSVVPMMVLLPIPGGSEGAWFVALNVVSALARAALLLAIALILSRKIMPPFLHLIASGRSQEMLLLVTLTICLGMAWVSHALGVSYALGAFLAGLILGGTDYAHQMSAGVVPFRDVFSGVFFVTMGMLLDPQYVVSAWPEILLFLGIILIGKTVIAAAAISYFGYPPAVALQVGFNLAQVGEFSFLIALMGVRSGLIAEDVYKIAIAASVISMILAPFLTLWGPRLASLISRRTGGLLPHLDRLTESPEALPGPAEEPLANHIVLLGYGTVGRTLGEVLLSNHVPFVALELDPSLVREARRRGHPVRYGDASSEELMRRAGVDRARMLVITLPDPVMERTVIKHARRMKPDLFILARGRRGTADEQLYLEGADQVIHETFEVGVEFIARILRHLHYPKQEVERQIGRVRSGRYEIFKRQDFEPLSLGDVRRTLDTLRVEFLEIETGSPLAGKSLRDTGIREVTGALVLAVIREGNPVHVPDAGFILEEKDTIMVSGAIEQVVRVEQLINGETER